MHYIQYTNYMLQPRVNLGLVVAPSSWLYVLYTVYTLHVLSVISVLVVAPCSLQQCARLCFSNYERGPNKVGVIPPLVSVHAVIVLFCKNPD